MVGVVRCPHGIEVVALHHHGVAKHRVERYDLAALIVVLVSVRAGHRDAPSVQQKLPIGHFDLIQDPAKRHQQACIERRLAQQKRRDR